jgi:hypothetical protein
MHEDISGYDIDWTRPPHHASPERRDAYRAAIADVMQRLEPPHGTRHTDQ